jgi:hypothetical protein
LVALETEFSSELFPIRNDENAGCTQKLAEVGSQIVDDDLKNRTAAHHRWGKGPTDLSTE